MPADRTRPLLSSSTPSDDSGSVAIGADIVLTFNEAVKAGRGKLYVTNGATQTYLGHDGLPHTRIVNATDTRAIDVTDAAQVTFSGNTLTLNLAADLRGGTGYAVVMESGVVTDLAGNTFAGLTDANRLNFTTVAVDVTRPTVAALTLSDPLLELGEHASMTLTMSEKVSGITAADFDLVGASLDGPLTTTDGITWTARVVPETGHTGPGSIAFHAGHAVDMAGNLALATTTTLAFTVDTVAPTLVDSTPQAGDASSGALPTIALTFSEDVLLDAQTTFVLTSDKGDYQAFTGAGSGALAYHQATYTLTVTLDDAALDAGAHYRLTTAADLADVAGNVGWHAAEALLEFDTLAVAPAAPTLTLHTDSASRSGGANEATDGITNDLRIDVAGLQAGGSWEYSVDAGATWQDGGAGAPQFALADVSASYAAGQIAVRQYDGPGHTGLVSAVATMAGVTIDVTAPATTIDYASFNFFGGTNPIAIHGNLVRAGGTADFLEYTVDGGATWQRATASGASGVDIAQAAVPRGGAIGVQVSDAAGNAGPQIAGAGSVYIADGYAGTFTVTDGMALFAQRGNDTIEIAGTGFARIDGGRDTDTLRFTAALTLELDAAGGKLASIESIDMNAAAGTASTLQLTKDAVEHLTAGATLTIDGDAGDTVCFAGNGWSHGAADDGYITWVNDDVVVMVGVAVATA